MSRNINPVPQFFDNNGEPLALGQVYYFESGTNTPKVTYSDVNETVANTHPVILTGSGRLPNVFFSGTAKQVLTDANGIQIWERDPVSSTDESSFGQNWDAVTIFSLNEVVTFDDVLYVSIINNNQNNNPASDTTAWTQFDLVKRWNTNETYKSRDPVIATDFTLYISQTNGNLGNDPVTDGGVNWLPSGAGAGGNFSFTAWDNSKDYGIGEANIVEGSDNNYYVSLQTPNLNNDPTLSPAFWLQVDFITGGEITISDSEISSTAGRVDVTDTIGVQTIAKGDIATIQAVGAAFWNGSFGQDLTRSNNITITDGGAGGGGVLGRIFDVAFTEDVSTSAIMVIHGFDFTNGVTNAVPIGSSVLSMTSPTAGNFNVKTSATNTPVPNDLVFNIIVFDPTDTV